MEHVGKLRVPTDNFMENLEIVESKGLIILQPQTLVLSCHGYIKKVGKFAEPARTKYSVYCYF